MRDALITALWAIRQVRLAGIYPMPDEGADDPDRLTVAYTLHMNRLDVAHARLTAELDRLSKLEAA